MNTPANEDRVRARKTSELVARRIAAAIVDDGMKPGDGLPQEAVLQKQYGVGRTTLREGLRLLETQGVLDLKAGRGPVIRQPTPADLVNSVTLLLQFQGATFETLLRARLLFEPPIAAAAARAATADDVAGLRRCVEQSQATDARWDEQVIADISFHRAMATASHDPIAEVVVESLISAITIDIGDIPDDHNVSHDNELHLELIDAVENHKDRVAEMIMRQHLEELLDDASRRPSLFRRPVRWV